MKEFKTKQELIDAYVEKSGLIEEVVRDLSCKYLPHLYRGGFVIIGFGYSVERIGVNVNRQNSGDPLLCNK